MLMKKVMRIVLLIVLILVVIVAGALVKLSVQTSQILDDYSYIYNDEKYSVPVNVENVDVITQHVSCGYACIEMFSKWNGGDVTEDSLFSEYGKVVTSTGVSFEKEMNKQFPEYKTTIHKYLKDSEIIDMAYENLSRGIPVPFEWAAQYGDVWTLHYSLLVGIDIPGDKVTVANPYGYMEEISMKEFLSRTSFEAYENMPFYFKMAFAIGLFEKNTIFTVETKNPEQVADETPAQQSENSGEITEQITNEQAFNAVMNYCKSVNPDFSAEINTEGYTEYWDTTTDESGEILVIYRSYTGAQTRYHIDPVSGEAYVTELVPGIIDEEQPTGETFNAREYLK